MTDEAFWRLSYRDWSALMYRRDVMLYTAASNGALSAWATYNTNRKKGRKPFTVEDIVGKPPWKSSRKKSSKTAEQMLAIAAMVTHQFGGKDLRKREQR